MVHWNKFDENTDLQEIVSVIGMDNECNYTTKVFLVLASFTGFNSGYTPRFATISTNGKLRILVNGMTGNVKISHWSYINLPPLQP